MGAGTRVCKYAPANVMWNLYLRFSELYWTSVWFSLWYSLMYDEASNNRELILTEQISQ